ncbi:MAG TPA: SAM-dependent methyltransferase [Candidatus Binatia bacterium]|nr:SAM-dependent methyltransferase [Candidatus Binatia bacterium]
MQLKKINDGSFRDPSGFVFESQGTIYRQVNLQYREPYDFLMSSGLYQSLVHDGLLVAHQEIPHEDEHAYKIIRPEKIPFISYPYEWCFSQLKDAALLTLEIQKRAIRKGMSLKDASAYNIQFLNGKPILIDTLSFELLKKGSPWVGYRQFCQHFLAPLLLQAYTDVRLSALLRENLDGIPLDFANKLLPMKAKLSFGVFSHISLHAKSQQKYGGKAVKPKTYSMSEQALFGLIDSLESTIRGLKLNLHGTEWDTYYESNNNYEQAAADFKLAFIRKCVKAEKPKMVWDVGANDGKFSTAATDEGCFTVSMDIDPVCVERNYVQRVKTGNHLMLPLIFDVTNPSPGIGWENAERKSLTERGPADLALALALVHHLAISNNVPLRKIAEHFSHIARSLVIEFVPKSDSQVKKLLTSREDIFPHYTKEGFEHAFGEFFTIAQAEPIIHSERTLYFMKNAGKKHER